MRSSLHFIIGERAMYEVVWPRGKKVVERGGFARRLDSLEGKTVGFLWDWIFRGDEIFPVIQKELAKRYSRINFVGYDKFGTVHGVEERDNIIALPDKLKDNRVQAVITGIGC